LRPARRAAVHRVAEARVDAGRGLVGDHAQARNADRGVTLITTADIDAVAEHLGQAIDPRALRRNLLLEASGQFLRIGQRYVAGGEVILLITGSCAPCGRMRDVLGEPGFQAMRGHGGMTARVIRGGSLRVGEMFKPLQLDLFE
jgi:MOSC domain-containing protein YiiM